MEIARIVKQHSPVRFSFVTSGDPSIFFMPGDFLEIVSPTGGGILIIVEQIVGQYVNKQKGFYAEYTYIGRFASQGESQGVVGLSVRIPTTDTITNFFAKKPDNDFLVGELAKEANHIPVLINGSKLLDTHSCFFGTSGSGKTTLLGVVIEQILLKLKEPQVIVLDLNSSFTSFNQPLTEAEANYNKNKCATLSTTDILSQQAIIHSLNIILNSRPKIYLGRLTPTEFLQALPKDNIPETDYVLRTIFKRLNLAHIPITIEACIEELHKYLQEKDVPGNSFDSFIPIEIKRQATFVLEKLFQTAKEEGIWTANLVDSLDCLKEPSLARFIQFDLGHLPYPSRSMFSERIFQFLWDRNEAKPYPTFIVVDEAHNLAPTMISHYWQSGTLEWLNRIAGEGRKYGLYLLLASQRPAKIHSNTLDNCRNFFLLNMQNQDDLETIARRTTVVSRSLINRIAFFNKGQTLIFGDTTPPVIINAGRRFQK